MPMEVLQLPSLSPGRLGSSLDQTVLLSGHSAVLILPACVIHAEVSKLVHSSPPLFVSSACTKWLLILTVRHAEPSAFMHVTHSTLQVSLVLEFHTLVLMCDAGQVKKGQQHAERHCSCVALGKLQCKVAAKCQTARSLTPVRHTTSNPCTSQLDPHMASGHIMIVCLSAMQKDWIQQFAPMSG